MNDYRPELPLLMVGDRLTQRLNKRRNYTPEDVTVQVIKVGRLWAYARKLEDLDRESSHYDIKFSKATGFIHGGNFSSPGRVGSEAQFAWDDRAQLANMVAADQGDKPI